MCYLISSNRMRVRICAAIVTRGPANSGWYCYNFYTSFFEPVPGVVCPNSVRTKTVPELGTINQEKEPCKIMIFSLAPTLYALAFRVYSSCSA